MTLFFHSEYMAETILESKQVGHGEAIFPLVTSRHIPSIGHEVNDFPAAAPNMLKPTNVSTGWNPSVTTLSCRLELPFQLTEPAGLSSPGPQLS